MTAGQERNTISGENILEGVSDPTIIPTIQAFGAAFQRYPYQKRASSLQADYGGFLYPSLNLSKADWGKFFGGLREVGLIRTKIVSGDTMLERENALLIAALCDTAKQTFHFAEEASIDPQGTVRALGERTLHRLGKSRLASVLRSNIEIGTSDIRSPDIRALPNLERIVGSWGKMTPWRVENPYGNTESSRKEVLPQTEQVVFSEEKLAEDTAVMWDQIGKLQDATLRDLATTTEVIIQREDWPQPRAQFSENLKEDLAEEFSIRPGDVPNLLDWFQSSGLVSFETNPQTGEEQIDSDRFRAVTLGMAAIRQKIGPVRVLDIFKLSSREIYNIAQQIGVGYPGLDLFLDPGVDSLYVKPKVVPPGRTGTPIPGSKFEMHADPGKKEKRDKLDEGQSAENYKYSSLRDRWIEYNKERKLPEDVWAKIPAYPEMTPDLKARVEEVMAIQSSQKKGVPRLDDDLAGIFYAPYGQMQIETILRDMMILKSDSAKFLVMSEALHPLTIQAIRFLAWVEKGYLVNQFVFNQENESPKDFLKDLESVNYKMMERELDGSIVTLYDLIMEEIEGQRTDVEIEPAGASAE